MLQSSVYVCAPRDGLTQDHHRRLYVSRWSCGLRDGIHHSTCPRPRPLRELDFSGESRPTQSIGTNAGTLGSVTPEGKKAALTQPRQAFGVLGDFSDVIWARITAEIYNWGCHEEG
jgi:hypothetical protein